MDVSADLDSNDRFASLDDDDRYLIRTLFIRGHSISKIAKRIKIPESLVLTVLEEYEKNGGQKYKLNDYLEAAFWFFQYKRYMLQNGAYAKYDIAKRRCENSGTNFCDFLQEETSKNNITDYTNFDEVKRLWTRVSSQYQELFIVEAHGQQREKETNIEEQVMEAVCKITLNNESHCGFFRQFGVYQGIMTCNKLLSSEEKCSLVTVTFETIRGITVLVTLEPKKFFVTDKKLKITFVACDITRLEEEDIYPLKDTGKAQENAPIFTYYHFNGKQKVQKKKKNYHR